MAHMLTGCEVDASIPIKEWCDNIWKNEFTVEFYKELQGQNYKVNIFITDSNVLTSSNGCEILKEKVSNVTDDAGEVRWIRRY